MAILSLKGEIRRFIAPDGSNHTLGVLTPMRFAIDTIDPDVDIRPNVSTGWFDPHTALRPREEGDIGLLIADGYSIFWTVGEQKPILVGKLSADRSTFLSALDYSDYDKFSLAKLSWKHHPELTADPAQQEAADILQHPISVNAINLSLAVKVAMRRLLRIPIFFS